MSQIVVQVGQKASLCLIWRGGGGGFPYPFPRLSGLIPKTTKYFWLHRWTRFLFKRFEFKTGAPTHLQEAKDTSSRLLREWERQYITIQLCKNALNDFKVGSVAIAAACLVFVIVLSGSQRPVSWWHCCVPPTADWPWPSADIFLYHLLH